MTYEFDTFTTRRAASSAGNPRHDCAAISDDTASQTPSEAIISLPPVLDNYMETSKVGHFKVKRVVLKQESTKRDIEATFTCLTYGIGTINSPTSMSPIDRERHKPPGQQRRGPT